jgi:uncharacterized cysteine cluster protein YcgN (CxxCxxCC family)
MKGGANLEDQTVISRAVLSAAEDNDGVLDVPVLAASLDIPLDVCQSYVNHFAAMHGCLEIMKSPLEVSPLEVSP